ncbi:MAG: DUF4276 family protein [SAR202 cluster bacterium]|nr:DUF4276 family protein [SAR202 cluster bacterium]
MKRVLALVEGQTEERFVKDVLAPHLLALEVSLTPTIATTKRVKRGAVFQGGITDYQKVERDVKRLLGDSGVVAVTTFIDYYGLPSDFPGMESRLAGSPVHRAQHVEIQWKSQIGDRRFRPYLMVHEFEALLFCKPEAIGVALNMPAAGQTLTRVRESFSTPEEINDNPESAPSKRIMHTCPSYQKVVHGPLVAQRIGLTAIRQQCAHFDDWVKWLESL